MHWYTLYISFYGTGFIVPPPFFSAGEEIDFQQNPAWGVSVIFLHLGENFAWGTWVKMSRISDLQMHFPVIWHPKFEKFSPAMVGYTNLTENPTNIL